LRRGADRAFAHLESPHFPLQSSLAQNGGSATFPFDRSKPFSLISDDPGLIEEIELHA